MRIMVVVEDFCTTRSQLVEDRGMMMCTPTRRRDHHMVRKCGHHMRNPVCLIIVVSLLSSSLYNLFLVRFMGPSHFVIEFSNWKQQVHGRYFFPLSSSRRILLFYEHHNRCGDFPTLVTTFFFFKRWWRKNLSSSSSTHFFLKWRVIIVWEW